MGGAWLRLLVLCGGVRRYREVRALARLAGELRALDVPLRVEESVLALFVSHELVHPRLCVSVAPDLWVFTWRGGYHQHPATDPAGAAGRIAAYVSSRAASLWAAS
jgi:hypothetical protein